MTELNSLTSTFTLNNGLKIPIIGFGTWQSPSGDAAYNAVKWALEAGYRHIDTAAAYKNEESVGKAIKDSGIPREDIFLTTKLWNADRGTEQKTLKAFEQSLKKLGTDYVDLYLIHWPNPINLRDHWQQANANDWQAMEQIYKNGQAKSIGISNFLQEHIDELTKTQTIAPMVNQIFLNPGDLQQDLVDYSKTKGMLLEAYSPLGTGRLLEDATVKNIAQNHSKTVPQVLIRWSLQHDFLPLPKSTHKEYIQSNVEVFDFELTQEEMNTLDKLEGTLSQHSNPNTVGF